MESADQPVQIPPELADKLFTILQEPASQPVRYADGDGKVIPFLWAEHIITRLHQELPVVFGKYISELVTEGRSARKRANGQHS